MNRITAIYLFVFVLSVLGILPRSLRLTLSLGSQVFSYIFWRIYTSHRQQKPRNSYMVHRRSRRSFSLTYRS